jgi:hypothetical protein
VTEDGAPQFLPMAGLQFLPQMNYEKTASFDSAEPFGLESFDLEAVRLRAVRP